MQNSSNLKDDSAEKERMNRVLNHLSISWSIIVLALVMYTDFALPKVVCISDYLMTFHTAGRLILENRPRDLYPPPGATSFVDAPFDRASHRIVPELQPSSTSEYMYPPLCALFFTPCSLLPPYYSIAAWQILSICALLGSAYFLVSGIKYSGMLDGVKNSPSGLAGLRAWAFLAYLPTTITIWIGQVGLILGILPLCAGYYFAMRQRPLLSGLLWSLTILKPQFMIPALVTMAVQCLNRRFKTAIGFCLGAASIAALNVILFSPSMVMDWLRCLKLSDAVYSNIKFGVASHLMISLPRAVILLFPVEQQPPVRLLVFALAGILLLVTLFALFKQSRLLADAKLLDTMSLALGAFTAPLVVPYLFLYDLCIWLIPGVLAMRVPWPNAISTRVKNVMIAAWLLSNLYTMIVICSTRLASPILFVISVIVLWVALCAPLLKLKEKTAGLVQPGQATDSAESP